MIHVDFSRLIPFSISNSCSSMSRLGSSSLSTFLWVISILFTLSQISNAQPFTTPPSEVRAVNSIFQQWNVQAPQGQWNISGQLCSGTALNGSSLDFVNPSIVCNCTYDNDTTCHIIQLRVNGFNEEGGIPEELTALPYLQRLRIEQNSLSGPLPAFIGNLTALWDLHVSHNTLSGPIPKELGNLKELEILALSTNNFSGTLPPELGNLPKLRLVYLDSSGLGGEIPPTFANLQKMMDWWASDCAFTGKIPDFIGNWTKLERLRLQGNNFDGPIPSSFANLTSLTSLRISDLQNVSSSLDFIKNLRNLTNLVLRNALISGSIPSEIISLQKLVTLDLSFNNLTGSIPSEIMNMTSLTSLFLGNNSLTGNLLPDNNLLNIDLSYNHLSGPLPDWVNLNWRNLQLSLVANNFKFDSTNITRLPGLVCLQRDFPCNKNNTPYSSFAIKCGGSEFRPRNGIVYEPDNSTTLGPASYFVATNSEKWAVSNGGVVIDRDDPAFIATSTAEIANTNTPTLFRTARVSPGSLRYYGLGLQNGPYTVSLMFAEILFNKTNQLWKGHGRRIFDIYIQGSLQQKDFDISKEAGGIEIALTKNFKAAVTQNYLEIHLFWAGKGTCCIPEQGNYGPLISALSVSPDFKVRGESKSKSGMIAGIVVSVAVFSLVFLAALIYWRRRGSKRNEEEAILGVEHKVKTYSYAELKTATGDFSASNRLGEGGFGPVYKGTLNDGRVVAVKQLSVASSHGREQFVTEISTISAVQHWNLVKLYGCCIEGNRKLLVYEYLENNSLDQLLFGQKKLFLDWPTRFNICLGTAKGLAYLHEESRPRIVHRDVKASNILLDAELCPKISDFGLAKLYDDKKTHISTRVAGTIGYLAPEYAMHGHLTSKADVFGYGVVCLEIVSGRPNYDAFDPENKFLLHKAWNLYESYRSLDLVDPTLTYFNKQEADRVIGVALLCIQASPSMRPTMSRVIAMLSGDVEVNPVTSKPSYLTDWDFNDLTTYTEEEPLRSNTSSTVVGSESVSPVIMTEMMANETLNEGR